MTSANASHVESNALALTPWGASTLDALQSSSEADREAVARRACEDAVADARSMVSLQGSLFEKLLVIERFGLYRALGHGSIQEFLEKAVVPVVQMHRGTLYRLKDAVWEAGRLLQQYGSVKADWSHLSLLAGETRRQEKGQGTLPLDEYERISREVAEGSVSHRDLSARLQKPERRVTRAPIRNVATRPQERGVVRRATPFEELARITADVRRPVQRPTEDLGPVMTMARELVQRLDRLVLQPADGMAVGGAHEPAFRQLMAELAETAAAASRIGRREEAA